MKKPSTGKLRVGIDAKWFFEGPPSGNMVVKNLVDEMVKNNKDRFSIYLFINRKFRSQALAHFPADVKLIFLPRVPNLISNLFILPFAALYYGLSIVLFQNFISVWPTGLFKIAYIHDVLFLDYPQYYTKPELFYFRNMKRLAARANMIITISDTEKQRLINNNVVVKNDIAVVYHGINKNFKPLSAYPSDLIDQVKEKYHLPDKYLLFVGRVNTRKNLINLVKAMPLLNDGTIKLVIVGEHNNSNEQLENYIAAEGIADRIIFTGHVPEDDLYLIYAKATVFCFPSYAEGFGLPPLEAMQCGVPVVVSNRTAMPEICGDAGVYINPDDVADISLKINSLLNNKFFYDEKVINGLNHTRGFVWEKAANEILTLINYAYAS